MIYSIEGVSCLLQAIDEAPDAAAIEQILLQFIEPYGLFSIFGGILPTGIMSPHEVSKRILLQRSPAGWRERYIQKGYLYRDPIFEKLQHASAPFTWHEAASASRRPETIAIVGAEAAAFGLVGGIAVPIRLPDGATAAVSFGGSNADLSPTERGQLTFIANYAFGRTINFIARKNLYPMPLTPREHECLLWASEGKTDWEIARILGISTPTVTKHMLSSKQKLGAVTKTHAVAIAVRSRIVR